MTGRLLAAALLAATTAATTISIAAPARADDQEVYVVLTSADAQVQAMAMNLAGEVTKRRMPVRMLLCGPGGDVAFKGHVGPAVKPAGKTPQQMLQGLIQAGVTVNVCALVLPNSDGKTAADLIDGVSPTSPPPVVDHLLKPNVRSFTF
jgi:predicted peroxiredoxin